MSNVTSLCNCMLFVSSTCMWIMTSPFHQYQQNEHPALTSKPLIQTKRPRHTCITLEIHVLLWDRHKNVAGLNRLLGSPSPFLKYQPRLIQAMTFYCYVFKFISND